MKSVLLTILIFAAVFLLVKSDVLFIIGTSWFHYLSYASLAIVMFCGIWFTIFHNNSSDNSVKNEENIETAEIEDDGNAKE